MRANVHRCLAFSLLELLAVIAIIALLAAILFPALNSAKGRAEETAMMQHMRQAGLALLMYQEDHGDLPPAEVAKDLAAKLPTCDPLDNWRPRCSAPSKPHLLGSFGYARSVGEYQTREGWDRLREETGRQRMLLVSIFRGSRKVEPFDGDVPPYRTDPTKFFMPDRLPAFYEDGSLQVITASPPREGVGYLIFTWPEVFRRSKP